MKNKLKSVFLEVFCLHLFVSFYCKKHHKNSLLSCSYWFC